MATRMLGHIGEQSQHICEQAKRIDSQAQAIKPATKRGASADRSRIGIVPHLSNGNCYLATHGEGVFYNELKAFFTDCADALRGHGDPKAGL